MRLSSACRRRLGILSTHSANALNPDSLRLWNHIGRKQLIDSQRLCRSVSVMVAARANWKGYIKFGEVACAVALYTAASSSERIAFNTLNRATGNRVRREFIDSETGEPVERDDQVKGYEMENGD